MVRPWSRSWISIDDFEDAAFWMIGRKRSNTTVRDISRKCGDDCNTDLEYIFDSRRLRDAWALLPVIVNILTVLYERQNCIEVSHWSCASAGKGVECLTHPNDPNTRGYHSCFSNPPVYMVLIPPLMQLIEISDGASRMMGPSLS